MNWKNCFRLLIPTIGITAASMFSQGCASNDAAPFHMYDSPLLEGRVESRYPRSRDYDPLKAGDHVEPTTYYAEGGEKDAGRTGNNPDNSTGNKRGGEPASRLHAREPAVAQAGADRTKKTPALSTRKQARAGAPATTQASSRADAGSASTAEPKASTTDHAADYVWSVYGLNGVTFSQSARGSVATLFRECKERGKIYHSSQPAIGDVVFFHNTDDFNDDGRNNDWYTHAAIVEAHGSGGQLTLLGYRGGKVVRFQMNLESPDAAMTRHGEVANAQLRPKRSEDAPFTQYLAGQLFAGTCSVLGDRSEMVVIDNWKPGMKLK